jgi:hypothetical protein
LETINEIHRLITERVLPAEHSGNFRENKL